MSVVEVVVIDSLTSPKGVGRVVRGGVWGGDRDVGRRGWAVQFGTDLHPPSPQSTCTADDVSIHRWATLCQKVENPWIFSIFLHFSASAIRSGSHKRYLEGLSSGLAKKARIPV